MDRNSHDEIDKICFQQKEEDATTTTTTATGTNTTTTAMTNVSNEKNPSNSQYFSPNKSKSEVSKLLFRFYDLIYDLNLK